MDFKKCIVESGKKLENSGLTVETWGNISIRDPETGLVYLTPSAMKYSTIVEDDVVVCRLDGTIVEGHRKPTIETGLHLAIYRNRESENDVRLYSSVLAISRTRFTASRCPAMFKASMALSISALFCASTSSTFCILLSAPFGNPSRFSLSSVVSSGSTARAGFISSK